MFISDKIDAIGGFPSSIYLTVPVEKVKFMFAGRSRSHAETAGPHLRRTGRHRLHAGLGVVPGRGQQQLHEQRPRNGRSSSSRESRRTPDAPRNRTSTCEMIRREEICRDPLFFLFGSTRPARKASEAQNEDVMSQRSELPIRRKAMSRKFFPKFILSFRILELPLCALRKIRASVRGCSAVRLARQLRELEVAGSNPVSPTNFRESLCLGRGIFVCLLWW